MSVASQPSPQRPSRPLRRPGRRWAARAGAAAATAAAAATLALTVALASPADAGGPRMASRRAERWRAGSPPPAAPPPATSAVALAEYRRAFDAAAGGRGCALTEPELD